MAETITIDRSELMAASAELMHLRALTRLATLASDAVRVLAEVDEACQAAPELGKELSRSVELRSQWREYDQTCIAITLDAVSDRLFALGCELEVFAIKGGSAR